MYQTYTFEVHGKVYTLLIAPLHFFDIKTLAHHTTLFTQPPPTGCTSMASTLCHAWLLHTVCMANWFESPFSVHLAGVSLPLKNWKWKTPLCQWTILNSCGWVIVQTNRMDWCTAVLCILPSSVLCVLNLECRGVILQMRSWSFLCTLQCSGPCPSYVIIAACNSLQSGGRVGQRLI